MNQAPAPRPITPTSKSAFFMAPPSEIKPQILVNCGACGLSATLRQQLYTKSRRFKRPEMYNLRTNKTYESYTSYYLNCAERETGSGSLESFRTPHRIPPLLKPFLLMNRLRFYGRMTTS